MALSKIDPAGLDIGQIGGRRNIIINGDLKISQRGDFTSATALPSDAYYGVDRWKMWDINVSSTFTHTKNVTVNGLNTNSLKMQATSSATGRLLCRQIIERDPNSSYLQSYGQEMTFSVWMKSNSSNARPIIFDPTTDASAWIFGDSHTGGGDWEKLTVQYTGGTTSAASSHIEISCNISSNTNGNVSISSGDYIEIAFAQFEVGDTATPFEHRSYGEELALCQRYYSSARYAGTAVTYTTNVSPPAHYHPVTMRSAPSLSFGSVDSSNSDAISGLSSSVSGTHFNDDYGFATYITSSSTGYGYVTYSWEADAEL